MANSISGVNPQILRWARERSGYTTEGVAHAFKKDASEIEGWESGASAPTYVQLEKLAYQLYKRPLAIFFFPEPPQELDQTSSFRTLPQYVVEEFSADTRYALRQAEVMQLSLLELNDGINPSEQKVFVDVPAELSSGPTFLADQIREYLGIDLENQTSWGAYAETLGHWREVIQEKGIFVFKRSFKQRSVSGFSLVHPEFPIIYLNNSTAVSRQIFTLFHELSHILLETSGVTKQDDSYIESLSGDSKEIEIFCNQFAGEFLVPSQDFEQHLATGRYDDETVRSLAESYKVSREVILRKLLDRGVIQREYYLAKAAEWNQEYEGSQGGGSGGNYYATQASYLGDKFLHLAFGKYYEGRVTFDQLADYLNIKARNVPPLEQFFFRKETV